MKKNSSLVAGSSENSPEIRYLTGLNLPDEFLCIVHGSTIYALVSTLEIDRARHQAAPGVLVVAERDYGNTRSQIIINAAKSLGITAFDVPGSFPLLLAEKLRAGGIELHAVEGSFLPEREFKSPAECAAVTATQRAGEAGFARACQVLKEAAVGKDKQLFWQDAPLTSEILRAEIDCAILRCGALPTGTICAGGRDSAQPHNAGSGILFAHTPIVMDIFPRSAASGYWGDLTRTVVKGEAPEIVRKAYAAVLEARECAKAAIAIGVSGRTLHEIADKVLQKHHFFTGEDNGTPFGFFHGLGHGVGLEIHEAPRLSPRSDSVLQGGEIMTIEPGVYYSEWGGIRLEDLIYLDREGKTHCLTEAPDFLTLE